MILYFILSVSCAYAEEVIMLTSPPSVEELTRMLRGKPVEQMSGSEKTRGGGEWEGIDPSITKTETLKSSSSLYGIPIHFLFGSDTIKRESREFVERIGRSIKIIDDGKFLIEGHTDAVGFATDNIKLSIKRAASVKDYLVRVYKIPSRRLIVSGQGENKPLDGIDPYDGKNRRVHIKRLE